MIHALKEAFAVDLPRVTGAPRISCPLNRHVGSFAGYTNAGVLAALALFFAGFSRPALLAAPYALAVVAAVWRWGRGQEANMPRALLRAGQLYAGADCRELAGCH